MNFKIKPKGLSDYYNFISELEKYAKLIGANQYPFGYDKEIFIKFNITQNFKNFFKGRAYVSESIFIFLGFSRIEGFPIFKSYHNNNIVEFYHTHIDLTNCSFEEIVTF